MSNKNIVFIGLSGCGKTTIGKITAQKLSLPFYDVDQYIEEKENKKISEIFIKGEPYFREIESKAIDEIIKNDTSVISTGGGAVTVPHNMKVLSENSLIIFINRPIENIIGDIDVSNRPLLSNDVNKLYKLYNERYELYKKYSDIEIINDSTLNAAVEKILQAIKYTN